MLIHRMTAVFGKLQGSSLELREGLNILQAPNESGKSTWCAFLLAMLYGINSRERDRAGFIADKNRYSPWSGTAMGGRLECRCGEDELTVTRATRRQNAPMGEFRALYAGTGDAVPELTGTNFGESVLGVSREVYERSAFIRQSGLAITQDPGLERRISSLITSGEEDVSCSDAAEALKKQLNRRRHNKTGQLPALEAELRETERQIAGAETLGRQLLEVQAQSEELDGKRRSLEAELARQDRWDAWQQAVAYREDADRAKEAENRVERLRDRLEQDRVPANDVIARLRGAIANLELVRKSLQEARDKEKDARELLLDTECLLEDSPFAGSTPEEAKNAPLDVEEKPKLPLMVLIIGALAGAVLGCGIFGGGNGLSRAVVGGVGLFGVVAMSTLLRNDRQKRIWQAQYDELREVRDRQAAAYAVDYQRVEAARAELARRTAAADTLNNTIAENEQGILMEVRRFAPSVQDVRSADQALLDCVQLRKELRAAEEEARDARMRLELRAMPEAENVECPAAAPARSREAVQRELEDVRLRSAQARSAADRLAGQLHASGDPVLLHADRERIQSEIRRLEEEYQALAMALDALKGANTALQSRFSPALGQRTAEIFGELTEHRYGNVVLDRSFHLSAEPAGDTAYRDAQLLSAGAADQLYLAARLAICQTVLPEENRVPIVLDDALANFDDDRCAAALLYLKQEAEHRQILLFTCHSREADFFAGDPAVSIQRLEG